MLSVPNRFLFNPVAEAADCQNRGLSPFFAIDNRPISNIGQGAKDG